MPIHPTDGEFSLGLWLDPKSDEECDAEEYADNVVEMREQAEKYIAAGKYKYVVLYRWNPAEEDWDDLEHFTEADKE